MKERTPLAPPLRRPARSKRGAAFPGTPSAPAATAERSPSDPLFQKLRALRRRLADAQGVPAYVVFGDQVLWRMIDRRPTNRRELLQVSGVGPVKAERYGEAFLQALRVEGGGE
jgi:ATP-dependent DNA helicase RecQ